MRLFQQGSVNLPYNDDPVSLEVEISYGGLWYSINDHVNYRLGIEGFGSVEQTFRRKEVQSDFFKGTYLTGKVADDTKRTIQVYVRGQTMAQMANAREKLISWFTQDEFALRITTDDLLETMVCDCADYRVDGTHVFLHSRMCVCTFMYSVSPDVSSEMVV